MKHFASMATDVVVTGHDRSEIGLLVGPHPGTTADVAEHDGGLISPDLREAVAGHLRAAAEHTGGSSARIVRAMVVARPPFMTDGELTA